MIETRQALILIVFMVFLIVGIFALVSHKILLVIPSASAPSPYYQWIENDDVLVLTDVLAYAAV